VLAFASAAANLLNYVFAAVLSRALGPGQFGALAALLALGLIGSIPAVALQLAVARDVAGGIGGLSAWVRTAALIGGAVLVLALLLTPVARAYLDLGSSLSVVWLGVLLVPTTIVGALQGWLLGVRSYGRLGTSYLLLAGGRLCGGLVAAGTGTGVAGALAWAAVGATAACVATSWLVRGARAGAEALAPGVPTAQARLAALVAAGSATAAMLVMTNVDVVLARHYLTPDTSGHYGVAALFARAAFWAPNFIAVLVFPVLAHGRQRRSLLVSAGVTVAIGAVVVGASVILGGPLVRLTVGTDYGAAAALAPWFALLGSLCALLQLLLYAGLARRSRRVEAVVWAAIALEVLLVSLFFHSSAAEIVATAVVTCVLAVAAVAVVEWLAGIRATDEVPGSPSSQGPASPSVV